MCVFSSGGECSAEAGEHSGGSDSLENSWRAGLGSDLHCRTGEGKIQQTYRAIRGLRLYPKRFEGATCIHATCNTFVPTHIKVVKYTDLCS